MYDNDVMAVAGLGVAQRMGISVPVEVSIVSWDDSALCELIHPALTALRRDIAAVGSTAARMLRELAAGGHPESIMEAHARARGPDELRPGRRVQDHVARPYPPDGLAAAPGRAACRRRGRGSDVGSRVWTQIGLLRLSGPALPAAAAA